MGRVPDTEPTVKRVPWMPVLVYVVFGALAVFGSLTISGVDTEWRRPLKLVFKPLTTILLFAILGRPLGSATERFQRLISIGFLFSLTGDVALLLKGQLAFGIGLVFFLATHITYIVAFTRVGKWSPRLVFAAAIFGAATAWTIRSTWADAGVARIPVAIYGAALTTMVVTAWSTLGGRLRWAWPAAAGAVMFYIGDSSLALNAFANKLQHYPELLTMGVYWVGQLGIALAARAGVERPA